MSDNVAITEGSGATIGADEISSVKYQRVKVIIGADGVNDGDVASGNPLPISDAGGSLTVDGTVAVTNAGITTIAGAVAGTEMQCDVLSMPTVTVNAHAVTNAGTFAVQVDSCSLPTGAATAAKQLADGHSVTLAAGTAEVGKLAAGTALIGKVGIDQSTANANEVVVKSGSCTVDLGANNDVTVTNATAANCKVEATIAAAQTIAVTNAGTFAVQAAIAPATSGGLTVANFNTGDTYTALTATAQVIKATAGQLYGYYIYNPNVSAVYVHIYNIAAASVTVGTSTAQMVFCIPAGSAANLTFALGIEFTNAGWSIAATTTGGGNTAPTTALEAMVWYK